MTTEDYQHIEDLANRFFEGETTGREEDELYAFFSGKDLPERLLPYRPLFAYFEAGITDDFRKPAKETVAPDGGQRGVKRRRLIRTGIAASLLLLIALSPFFLREGNAFNPYEGSYIIRNGVCITDPDIIGPELEASLQYAFRQEEEAERLIAACAEAGQDYVRIERRIREQYNELLDRFSDEYLREEARRILEQE
jgi:hypothetical protein